MAKKTLKQVIKGQEYTVIVENFGTYKKGDKIMCHKSTGEALKSHKIVE